MTGPPDLDACAREPIHIPGSIQPHGVLLVVDPADGRVLQASANASAVLTDGVGRVTGEQFGALVQVDPGQAAWLRPTEGVAHVPAAPCTLVQTGDIGWNAVWHLYPRHWLLELEPARGASSLALTDALRAQRQIDRAGSIALAAHHAAAEIRALTGYDRVMVYRFDEHWHGDVIAEVHRAGLESYLGLHYPASDIPVQARARCTCGITFQTWIGFNDFQLNEVRRGDRDRLAVPQGHDALSLIQQPFSVVTDRFRVSRQLLEGFVVHEVPELTVVVQVSQVHIDNVRAFCGIGRFEGFLNAGTGQQTAQLNARKRLAFPWFNEFAGFYRIRFAI